MSNRRRCRGGGNGRGVADGCLSLPPGGSHCLRGGKGGHCPDRPQLIPPLFLPLTLTLVAVKRDAQLSLAEGGNRAISIPICIKKGSDHKEMDISKIKTTGTVSKVDKSSQLKTMGR